MLCGAQVDSLILRHRRHPPDMPYGKATLPVYRKTGRQLQRDGEDLA